MANTNKTMNVDNSTDYMEDDFEIHETDEEYSESNRDSQADLQANIQ